MVPSSATDSIDEQQNAGLDMLVRRLHDEVMQKLEDQNLLLKKALQRKIEPPAPPVLFDVQAADSNPSSPSMTYSPVVREVPSLSVGTGSASVQGPDREYRNKVCTYTSFDMQLREGADTLSSRKSRKDFAEINCKQDTPCERPPRTERLKKFVRHPYFDVFFAVVVLTNAVFIGIDLQIRLTRHGDQPIALRVIQYFYALLFAVELALRILAFGRRLLLSEDWMWSLLDIFIVATSLWEIAAGIMREVGMEDVSSIGGVSSLKAFRIIRLTRILKTVRVIRLFRFVLALRTLITSIFSTLKSLFWALMLLTLIVYVFAILFAQAISDYLETPDAVQLPERELLATERYYGDLFNTMLSLFMSIVGGVSWEEVMTPLKYISPIWVVLFMFYISFTFLAVQLAWSTHC